MVLSRRTFVFSIVFLLLGFVVLQAKAQPWDKIINFNPDDTAIASRPMSVYADTGRIYIAGETFTTGVTSLNSFLAGLDNQGQVVWKKQLYFPGQYNTIAGNRCLGRLQNGNLFAVGSHFNVVVNPQTWIQEPFFFFQSGR